MQKGASLLLVVSRAGITYSRNVELSLIFLLQCFFLLLQSPPSPLSLSVCAWGILTSHPILPKLQTGCQPCVFLVQFIQ